MTNNTTSNSIYKKTKKNKKICANTLIFISAIVSLSSFLTIIIYILFNGIRYISIDFFLPNTPNSILPEIINTIYIEIITLTISIPIGLGTAIYLTQYAKNKKLIKTIDIANDILASVPSILIGMIGYGIFCVFLGGRCSILAGSLTMIFCVLPIIVQTTKQAILSVPKAWQHGALALGASKLRSIFDLIIPCIASGILTAIILAAGKIIGESAALIMTTGTGSQLPSDIFKHIFCSGQTLSLHLFFVAGNSSSSNSINICFATATVLLIITFILNCFAKILVKHFTKY